MADRPTPTPVAEGSLAGAPFAQVLLYIFRKQLTGTLVVWPDQAVIDGGEKRQDRILFEEGRAVAAKLLEPASALDRGLLPLFHRDDAPYAFYEANLVGDCDLEGDVDPIFLMNAAMRGSPRPDAIASIVDRIGVHRVRWLPNMPVTRFGFDAEESAFVELLQAAPASVEELVQYSRLPRRVVHRIVYVLTLAKSVDFLDPETDERVSTGMVRPPGRKTESLLVELARRKTVNEMKVEDEEIEPDGGEGETA